jgi:pilus assembly protein CpaE
MLRGILISPDTDLNARFQQVLQELGLIALTRVLDTYPKSLELVRYVRTHAPQVVFVGTDSIARALEIVQATEKHTPGVQIVALGRSSNQDVLRELMRAGVREYASLPFNKQAVGEILLRIGEVLQANPVEITRTDKVFSFLPSKPGVGTSTIALNATLALTAAADTRVLLSDFDLNSGIVQFMLNLDNEYGVTDAAHRAFEMDETLWPQMVTTIHKLDVLHAGRLDPQFRIEPSQLRHLFEFIRRYYQILCFDMSGNLEQYSLEIMHESEKVFLVCTPELPSLHLARQKYAYLRQMDLHDRVIVLLNRYHKDSLLTLQQIEQLMGLPIKLTFPNDYQGVHRALTLGRKVESSSPLGKQFQVLAEMMTGVPATKSTPKKKRFLQHFSVQKGPRVAKTNEPVA